MCSNFKTDDFFVLIGCFRASKSSSSMISLVISRETEPTSLASSSYNNHNEYNYEMPVYSASANKKNSFWQEYSLNLLKVKKYIIMVFILFIIN